MTGPVNHPVLPGTLIGDEDHLGDVDQHWPVLDSTRAYDSGFLGVREDRVGAPDGAELSRTVVEHHGAVAVAAVDDQARVLLLRQYRHPVGGRLLELPAGILDVAGEAPADAAARELAEEADLTADRWEPLVRLYSSPGFTNERVEVYLATGLAPVPDEERTPRADEEADMDTVWVPLDDAVAAILDCRIANALAVAGILALAARS